MPTPSDTVPSSLWPYLRAHPHPPGSHAQNVTLGAQGYAEWSRERQPDVVVDPHPTALYQAQHGPLYYRGLVALKHGLGLESYEVWADASRAANVVLAAVVCVLWYGTTLLWFRGPEGPGLARMVGVALAANSLYHYNAVRIANDVLSLAFGSAALFFFVLWFKRRPLPAWPSAAWRAAAVGVCLGLAVAAKLTALPLIPVLGLGVGSCRLPR